MKDRLTSRQIWSAPVALAIISALGFACAILGNGIWDILGWMALAAPSVVTIWHIAKRSD